MTEHQTWREYLIERFTADKEEAIGYLDAALKEYQIDGATHLLLLALWTVVEAQGGIAELAKKTGEEPQFFSKMLSNREVPQLDTLRIILTALGCRLSIESLEDINPNLEQASKAAAIIPLEGKSSSLEITTESREAR